jgi:hypothetical protein
MAATNFTPISLYYSSTASAVPTAGNLVAGELALNNNDGKLFYKDSSGVVQVIGTKGGVGSSTTTQVLYNSSGLVVGSANMTFNGTTLTLANDASISGLTVGKGGGASAFNTAVGASALAANTSGITNSAFGASALLVNTTGTQNTAVGRFSLGANTSGSQNTVVGKDASASNTTGSNNTALGFEALLFNTTASNNTAVGYQAGYSNTTGTGVVAIGRLAMYSNTTGAANNAIGNAALYSNSTGTANNAFGQSTLYANSTGNYNTAFGHESLTSNTTASNNTAVGYQAGYSNTTGAQNIYMGNGAGYTNTTSGYNTFIGYQAGYTFNTSGNSFNTCLGGTSGYSLTTGVQNTFVGAAKSSGGAGYYVTTGSKNTILGAYNGNEGGLDIRTASNYIVLSDGDGNPRQIIDNSGNALFGTVAAQAPVTAVGASSSAVLSLDRTSNIDATLRDMVQFRRSVTSVGSITCSNTLTSYNTTSDYRLKNVIAPVTNAGERLDLLKPIEYEWKSTGGNTKGFLAHQFAEVYPNSVSGEKDAVDDEGNPVYQAMQASTPEVMADLIAEIQSLRKRVALLESK